MNLVSIKSSLDQYKTVGLKEINSLTLQSRIDTKYILNISEIPDILNQLKDTYQLVKIDGHEIHHYANIYFDTLDYDLFTRHHNGKANRYKVRKRKYVKSNLAFLEIKFKNNKGKTIKCRLQTENFTPILNKEEREFVKENSNLNPDTMEAVQFSDYHRLTLVNFETHERATMDLQLDFKSMDSERQIMASLAIIEVKQDKLSGKSELIQILKDKQIRTSSFSKYCIVSIHLNNELKYNTFKPILLHLQKIKAYDNFS